MPSIRQYEISFDLGFIYNGIIDWQHYTWQLRGTSERDAQERLLARLNQDPHSHHQVENIHLRLIGTNTYHEPKT